MFGLFIPIRSLATCLFKKLLSNIRATTIKLGVLLKFPPEVGSSSTPQAKHKSGSITFATVYLGGLRFGLAYIGNFETTYQRKQKNTEG